MAHWCRINGIRTEIASELDQMPVLTGLIQINESAPLLQSIQAAAVFWANKSKLRNKAGDEMIYGISAVLLV